MNRLDSVLRIHFVDRKGTYITPAIILVCIVAAILAVGVVLNLLNSFDPRFQEGLYQAQIWNGAVFGFLGAGFGVGAATMTQYLAFALGFGLTRREWMLGSALVFVMVAAALAIVVTALKVIEVATGGFGLGMRIFDTVWVSTGPWWETLVQTFLVALGSMVIAALMATIWNRWGKNGLMWVGSAGLVIGAVVFLVLMATNVEGLGWLWDLLAMPWIGWMGVLAGATLVVGAAWMSLGRFVQVR